MSKNILYIFLLFIIYSFFQPTLSCADENTTRILTTHMPPYSIEQNGNVEGVMLEIVQKMAEKIGNREPIEFLPWRRAQKETVSGAELGRNAVAFPMGRTAKRETLYRWVVNIITDPMALHTTTDVDISTYTATKNMLVGVLAGSSGFQTLEEAGYTNIVTCSNVEICAKMLDSGRIDAWNCPGLIAPYTFKKLKLNTSNLRRGHVIKNINFYLAGTKEIKESEAKTWQTAFEELKDSGELEKIIKAYK